MSAITKIYFQDATSEVDKSSRRFSGRGLHASDGWTFEVKGPLRVKLIHPAYGLYEVRGLRFTCFYEDGSEILTANELTKMNLPPSLWEADLEGVPDGIHSTIENYCRNARDLLKDGVGVALLGPSGAGKSGAAVVIAKAARLVGVNVFFGGVADLRECFRSRIAYDGELSIQEHCRTVGLLILDSLRQEDADTRDIWLNSSTLEALIETRTRAKRATIVTTQLGEAELNAGFPGMMSKLKGFSPWVAVRGHDRRDDLDLAARRRLGLK